MSKLLIKGGNPLNGSVRVRGAKNAALPVLISSVLSKGPVVLKNMPTELKDIQVSIEALRHIGCSIKCGDGVLNILPQRPSNTELSEEISGRFRSSLVFLGLLTGLCGRAKITLPGGCNLGDRKYDLHLEGLRKLGAEIILGENSIEVITEKLIGTDIHFYLPTTTGTENLMIAACFAKGKTRIFNANTRPEIVDMANLLNQLGANITVQNRIVEIEGPVTFTSESVSYSVMPGWDEALLYMMAAGVTGGEICVEGFTLQHIRQDTDYLRQAGLEVFQWGGNVYVSGKSKKLQAFDLFTAPYPGVNSDMQPLFAALAGVCEGESTITDQRFTDRFGYVTELRKLGVNIHNYGNCAVVHGPSELRANEVAALDLRCGAALILTALAAKGLTTISNCYQIYRGHEDVVNRLHSLGAEIEEDVD